MAAAWTPHSLAHHWGSGLWRTSHSSFSSLRSVSVFTQRRRKRSLLSTDADRVFGCRSTLTCGRKQRARARRGSRGSPPASLFCRGVRMTQSVRPVVLNGDVFSEECADSEALGVRGKRSSFLRAPSVGSSPPNTVNSEAAASTVRAVRTCTLLPLAKHPADGRTKYASGEVVFTSAAQPCRPRLPGGLTPLATGLATAASPRDPHLPLARVLARAAPCTRRIRRWCW